MFRYFFDRIYKCKCCGATINRGTFVTSYPRYLEVDSWEMENFLNSQLDATSGTLPVKLHYCGEDNNEKIFGVCEFMGLKHCSIKEIVLNETG